MNNLKKRIVTIFLMAMFSTTYIFAQSDSESNSESQEEGDEYFEDDEYSSLNETGDQFIRIGLMVTFPCNFGGSFPRFKDGQLSLGGAGTIGYHRFFTPQFAWGIDIAFGYNPTIGENMFTYVPLLVNLTYQPTFKKFEFPITVGIGTAMESYLNKTYFPGFVAKGEAGVFYRVSPAWSFGVNGNVMYLPQWYSDSSHNDYGIFSSFELTARYHF